MIIQSLAKICINSESKAVHYTAKTLDWVAATTLFVIGMLGICSTIHMHHTVAYSLFSAGLVYTIVMLLTTSRKLQVYIKN